MNVITRSGKTKELNLRKVRDKLDDAVFGIPGVSKEDIEFDFASENIFRDGMTTEEVNKEIVRIISNKIDVDTPNYSFVAARVVLDGMYHKVGHTFGSKKGTAYSHGFGRYLARGFVEGKFVDMTKFYSESEIEDFSSSIVPSRDTDIIIHDSGRVEGFFTYLGIKTYLDKYATYDRENNLIELPQHMFMAISMFLHAKETSDRTGHVKRFYDAISTFKIMVATPTLSNARKTRHQLSSCFVGTMDDQLAPEEADPNHSLYDGILGSFVEQSILSKFGGGIGWDWTDIRASGGTIDGYQGAAGGPIPFLHFENGLPIAVDQLGTRKGAIAVYLEPWHWDIEDFIDLKKTGGEERKRAHELFPALWVNDLFMERVESDGKWTLMDPHEVPDLHKLYGDEFNSRYEAYENDESIRRRVVDAKSIWKRVLTSYLEIGMPFLCFKDTANRANMNKHIGSILSSNLCTEIFQVTYSGRTAICNLGSVNLSKNNTMEEIAYSSRLLTRALDNVIDMNLYPLNKIRITAESTRAIGVGSMGEAEMIAHMGIMFGSDEHKELLKKIYRTIRQSVEDTSHELALEKGSYPEFEGSEWKRPMRNGYLMAIAPTSSISIFVGTTQANEPVFKKKWFEENLSGLTPTTAPGIHPDNYQYYPNAYEVDQNDILDLAKIRQDEIDQGQSLNIFVDPAKITGRELSALYIRAWKLGLKSTYYLRSKSPDEDTGLSVPDRSMECTGCQ